MPEISLLMREDHGSVEALRLRFDNGAPAQTLRHTARHTLVQAATESDPEWVDDALLVISELVQNVSQHTRSAGELIITIEPDTVLIEVGDTSTTVPQPRHPSPSQAGGRGLLLIDAISQQWGINTCPAGKAVWVRLATPPTALADREPFASLHRR